MNTHWNTVWSNRQSLGTFPVFMTTHINQSIEKVIQKVFSVDWLLQKVGRRKKSEKVALTGIRTPDLCNVKFDVELELPRYAEEEKRESALWCLLLHTVSQSVFIRQFPFSAATDLWPDVYKLLHLTAWIFTPRGCIFYRRFFNGFHSWKWDRRNKNVFSKMAPALNGHRTHKKWWERSRL